MFENGDNHIMTADEIDALFLEPNTVNKKKPGVNFEKPVSSRDSGTKGCEEKTSNEANKIHQTMADPDDTSMDLYDLKVLLVRSEKRNINSTSTGYAIKCSLWNNSDRKIQLLINNYYVIDLKKEQHTGQMIYDQEEAYMNASIQYGAHIIRTDGFKDSVIGELSPGYVYGLEIEDITNYAYYDIQFELGKDWKWRYRNIEVSQY